MSSQKFILIGLFTIFLSGCGILQPFVDRQRNPGQDTAHLYVGPSTPKKPVICYNPLITDDETLQKMADEECINNNTGKRAELVKKRHFDGRLLLPSHAYYTCVK
ncbi:MAG: hypothetical protein IJ677_01840 [Alphaproteobacteria bacterium]|nr:hypothetical protein [Alphaproteobacteria bacterium]